MWKGSVAMSDKLPDCPRELIAPHERQAQRNHGQDLDRLDERGGLNVVEAVAILEDKEWRAVEHMTTASAVERYHQLLGADR